MTQLLVESWAMFTDAGNDAQPRTLDATVSAIEPAACGPCEIRAMLALLESFPDEDGYGFFWSIVGNPPSSVLLNRIVLPILQIISTVYCLA